MCNLREDDRQKIDISKWIKKSSIRRSISDTFTDIKAMWDTIRTDCTIDKIFSFDELGYLHRLARDKEINPLDKHDIIKNIMYNKGFNISYTGTNRIAFMSDYIYTDVVIKVAFNDRSLKDSVWEMPIQEVLKPYVSKIFQVSPCGTISISERVTPILNTADMKNVITQVLTLLNSWSRNYWFMDISIKEFKNWGFREGFGPVLLDYSYFFKKDYDNPLKCNRKDYETNTVCKGRATYQNNYSNIVCDICGKDILPSEIEKLVPIGIDDARSVMLDEIRKGGKFRMNFDDRVKVKGFSIVKAGSESTKDNHVNSNQFNISNKISSKRKRPISVKISLTPVNEKNRVKFAVDEEKVKIANKVIEDIKNEIIEEPKIVNEMNLILNSTIAEKAMDALDEFDKQIEENNDKDIVEVKAPEVELKSPFRFILSKEEKIQNMILNGIDYDNDKLDKLPLLSRAVIDEIDGIKIIGNAINVKKNGDKYSAYVIFKNSDTNLIEMYYSKDAERTNLAEVTINDYTKLDCVELLNTRIKNIEDFIVDYAVYYKEKFNTPDDADYIKILSDSLELFSNEELYNDLSEIYRPEVNLYSYVTIVSYLELSKLSDDDLNLLRSHRDYLDHVNKNIDDYEYNDSIIEAYYTLHDNNVYAYIIYENKDEIVNNEETEENIPVVGNDVEDMVESSNNESVSDIEVPVVGNDTIKSEYTKLPPILDGVKYDN